MQEEMNPKVDFYFEKESKWQKEVQALRPMMLGCGLTEELKWGVPCYSLGKANVVLIHVFKEYCALLYFKGALLSDPNRVLIQQTENVQSARQLRFTSLHEIMEKQALIKAYTFEAIEVERAGLKVSLKKTADYMIPEEFAEKLNGVKGLKKAFDALTPGRQRAYIFYFSAPKQSKTRATRVENYIPQILGGKGLDD